MNSWEIIMVNHHLFLVALPVTMVIQPRWQAGDETAMLGLARVLSQRKEGRAQVGLGGTQSKATLR